MLAFFALSGTHHLFVATLAVCLFLSPAQGVPLRPDTPRLQPASLMPGPDIPASEPDSLRLRPDNSQVQVRVPSREVVDSLREDRDFSYLRTSAGDDSWWTRFWVWLGSLFTRAVSEGGSFNFWEVFVTRILPWTIALGAIVLVVIKLMGVDADSLLRKKSVSSTVPFAEAPDDIGPLEFDKRLEAALGQGNVRLAIRLYYLETLRQLSVADFIQWHPDKTNRHYLREIPGGIMQDRFGRLTRIFEYIWYGEAVPRDQDLEAVQTEFAALKKTIGGHEKD